MSYECKFCKKTFGSEKTLLTHLCEPKRRWNNRNEKNVQLAFRCFQHFWRITATNMKHEKTYDEFMNSKYYLAFVKFANYILGVYVANIETYIEWLLKKRVRIDKWSSDTVYEEYIKEFNVRESVDRAIERTILTIKDWAEENNKYQHNAIEFCLAHQLPDKIEKAYMKTDLIDARRQIMQDWENYILKK